MHISITNNLIFDNNNAALLFHNKNTNFEELIEDKKELDFIKECINKNDKFGKIKHITLRLKSGFKEIFLINVEKKYLTTEDLRQVIANGFRHFKRENINILEIYLNLLKDAAKEKDLISAATEAVMLANYNFDKYITKKEDSKQIQKAINLVIDKKANSAEAERVLEEYTNLSENVIKTRNVVNEPANKLTPTTFAEYAQHQSEKCGFEVEILNKKEIEKLGMGSYLCVAQGSIEEPKFVIMRYFGNKENKEILGLVGKGITFDTGGLCIKPGQAMLGMKHDMAGAAAVIGAISAIAENKLPANVIAVTALCENAVSGNATRPGDIVKSMAGKTIEVINTDAEGRLTLADAVYYIIQKEKVNKVVDVATLTGAAIVALGNITTAVLSNNDEFYKNLEKASNISGEAMWRLPNRDDYKKYLKSDIADLSNLNYSAGAGTILGGMFVQEFVGETPWLHLDIAGTDDCKADEGYYSKGATGVAVRTLYHLSKIEFGLINNEQKSN